MKNIVEFNKYNGINNVKFAISAFDKLKKNNSGEFMLPIQVKDNKMTVTDGHRLHIATIGAGIDDGYYVPIKNTKTCVLLEKLDSWENDHIYPDTDRIIPDLSAEAKWVLNTIRPGENKDFANYANIIRQMSNDTTINFYYLENVLDDGWEFKISQYNDQGPVVFESHERTALIMPVRV